jgi:hypothetical protein
MPAAALTATLGYQEGRRIISMERAAPPRAATVTPRRRPYVTLHYHSQVNRSQVHTLPLFVLQNLSPGM